MIIYPNSWYIEKLASAARGWLRQTRRSLAKRERGDSDTQLPARIGGVRWKPVLAPGLGFALKRSGGRLGENGELPVSRRLDELLRARIDAMAPKTWEMLTLAALLVDPCVSLLERACDDDVERSLAPARLAAIVALERGRVPFTHPLLAATCLAQLDEEEDAELAALLEQNANVLRARGARTAAGELLEHARRLTPADERTSWARRSTTLANALYHAGTRAS